MKVELVRRLGEETYCTYNPSSGCFVLTDGDSRMHCAENVIVLGPAILANLESHIAQIREVEKEAAEKLLKENNL